MFALALLLVLGSVDSKSVDVLVQPGGSATLEVTSDQAFGVCTLRNNVDQILCSHEWPSSIPTCVDNITYSFGPGKLCKFQVGNIQSSDVGKWSADVKDLYGRTYRTKVFNISLVKPEYGCYEDNVEYFGEEVISLIGTTLQSCQQSCAKSELCEFWAFRRSNQTCVLKNGDAFSRRSHNVGVVSGLKQCPGCFRLGLGTRNARFAKLPFSNEAFCRQSCHEASDCEFYQWSHIKQECRLFHSEVDDVIVDKDSLLSVPNCKDLAKLWKNNPALSSISTTATTSYAAAIAPITISTASTTTNTTASIGSTTVTPITVSMTTTAETILVDPSVTIPLIALVEEATPTASSTTSTMSPTVIQRSVTGSTSSTDTTASSNTITDSTLLTANTSTVTTILDSNTPTATDPSTITNFPLTSTQAVIVTTFTITTPTKPTTTDAPFTAFPFPTTSPTTTPNSAVDTISGSTGIPTSTTTAATTTSTVFKTSSSTSPLTSTVTPTTTVTESGAATLPSQTIDSTKTLSTKVKTTAAILEPVRATITQGTTTTQASVKISTTTLTANAASSKRTSVVKSASSHLGSSNETTSTAHGTGYHLGFIIGALLGSIVLCFAVVLAPFIVFKLSSRKLSREAVSMGETDEGTKVRLLVVPQKIG